MEKTIQRCLPCRLFSSYTYKKDGQVIDLADFEYGSKKQIFRKKVEEENFATKMSKVNDRTDISYEGLSGNMFNSDDD